MPKFLRAIRLDDSDDRLFRTHGAAREGDWLVSGGYAVCDFANAPKCDPRCHCESSFLALEARSRCSIAEVVEVTDEDLESHTDALAWFLVKGWGAPSWEVARRVAEEEVRHTAGVCESLPADVWISVKRTPSDGGAAVEEQYAVHDRLLVGSHKL